MHREKTKIALIPAYNPDRKLLAVLRDLSDSGFFIVLVNDGSDEKHQKLFDAAGRADVLLCHGKNLGKGEAIKTGLGWIRDNVGTPCTVVTVDADGQHRIDDIKSVIAVAAEHPSTLVIGSRKLGKGVPFRSRSGNFFTRTVLHALTPVTVYDTQSGLRAFSHELVPLLCELEGERYEYEMRVLIELTERHIPIIETPIRAVYIGDNSSSHFKTVSDARRVYRVIFHSAGKKGKTQKKQPEIQIS